MSETTIYIKGSAGFKTAIMKKLGHRWTDNAQDIDQETVCFSLNEITLHELKSSIGDQLLSQYDITLHDELPEEISSDTPGKYVPGQVFKMTIWANQDLKVSVNKNRNP
jgi:hypothetical protein